MSSAASIGPAEPEIYDLSGLHCPMPVLKTRKRLRDMASGSLLRVQTTDPLAEIDIPHFCNEKGHSLVSVERTPTGHLFVIRRGDKG